MRGWSWASSAALRLLGHAVAVHEQHRVAGLGRPRGGRHGEGGVVGGDDEDAIAALAARRGLEGVERARQRERVARRRCRSCAGPAGGRRRRRGRPARRRRPWRRAGAARRARRALAAGRSGPSESRIGGAHRRRGEDGAGDAGAPVARVDQRDGVGAVLGRRGGEDGPRDAGRVGDRVGAADARRVLGREGREAEVVGGLGLRALDAQAGRLVGRRSVVARRSARPHAGAASAASRQARTTAGRRIRRPTVREAGDGCAGHPAATRAGSREFA